jgi:hypothetical protein
MARARSVAGAGMAPPLIVAEASARARSQGPVPRESSSVESSIRLWLVRAPPSAAFVIGLRGPSSTTVTLFCPKLLNMSATLTLVCVPQKGAAVALAAQTRLARATSRTTEAGRRSRVGIGFGMGASPGRSIGEGSRAIGSEARPEDERWRARPRSRLRGDVAGPHPMIMGSRGPAVPSRDLSRSRAARPCATSPRSRSRSARRRRRRRRREVP